jgi:rRNA maturation endonuclease Nob1
MVLLVDIADYPMCCITCYARFPYKEVRVAPCENVARCPTCGSGMVLKADGLVVEGFGSFPEGVTVQ